MYRNVTDFYVYLDAVTEPPHALILRVYVCFIDSFGFSLWTLMSSVNRGHLTSFFLKHMLLFFTLMQCQETPEPSRVKAMKADLLPLFPVPEENYIQSFAIK